MQLCPFYLNPCVELPDKNLVVRFAFVWYIIFALVVDRNKHRYQFHLQSPNAFVALFFYEQPFDIQNFWSCVKGVIYRKDSLFYC